MCWHLLLHVSTHVHNSKNNAIRSNNFCTHFPTASSHNQCQARKPSIGQILDTLLTSCFYLKKTKKQKQKQKQAIAWHSTIN
jgi:histidinol phosphatase-like enzyme